MVRFSGFLARAEARHGPLSRLRPQLPRPASDARLASMSDADYLSLMSRRIFRAGLKHSLVDGKWPHFEEVFWGFDPAKMVLLDDAFFERCMNDRGLIRHRGKLLTIPGNAQFVLDRAREYGSFGKYLAQWPSTNIVGLWQELARSGRHLGGNSGPYFLRMAGKDTFLLTTDVELALKRAGLVDKKPSGKKQLSEIQARFNEWHDETGLPFCQLSRLLAMSVETA